MSAFEVISLIVLVGIWSCVGISYRNSQRLVRQFDDVIDLLKRKS